MMYLYLATSTLHKVHTFSINSLKSQCSPFANIFSTRIKETFVTTSTHLTDSTRNSHTIIQILLITCSFIHQCISHLSFRLLDRWRINPRILNFVWLVIIFLLWEYLNLLMEMSDFICIDINDRSKRCEGLIE